MDDQKLEQQDHRMIHYGIEQATDETRESSTDEHNQVLLPAETTEDVRQSNSSDRSIRITWDDAKSNDDNLRHYANDATHMIEHGRSYLNIPSHQSTGCLYNEMDPFIREDTDKKNYSERSVWSSWFRGISGLNVEGDSASRQLRQRSYSEPELTGWGLLSLRQRRRRDRPRANTDYTPSTAQATQNDVETQETEIISNTLETATSSASPDDVEGISISNEEQVARSRWIRINRRFQTFITVVALVFSILLFLILMSWVVLTSAYVISLENSCDVPLKTFYWLVSLQLLLDVFRNDILRFMLRWDSSHEQPARVILYNVTYLIFALLVMRMGVTSVFMGDAECRRTAPDLFLASKVFVSLSISAWILIFTGYLLPFTVVALLLTLNGYHPTHSNFPVFPPTTISSSDAVDHLKVVRSRDGNCCICLESLNSGGLVVETTCCHVFHRSCCREWLRQSKTCPVCRETIIAPNEDRDEDERPDSHAGGTSSSGIPLGPSGRPVVGLVRMIRQASNRLHEHRQDYLGSSIELRQRR